MTSIRLIPPGIAIVATIYGLARYTYGLFVPYIRQEFQLSIETLGMIASSSYISYMLATITVPWIIGRFGLRFPIVLGGTFATLGMALIGLSQNVWILAIGVIVAGASPGFAFPPLSDAVAQLIQKKYQSRTLTMINSGTGFGVMFAGPVALFAGDHWRWAWFFFAGFALISTMWNLVLLSTDGRSKKKHAKMPRMQWDWFFQADARPLFIVAFILGLATSVYWTFAVDLIVSSESFSTDVGQIFWIIVGVSGIIGGFAGDLITKFGLRKVLRASMIGLTSALLLLPLSTSAWFTIFMSAILFGSVFIMMTGLLGVWSVNVFYERPSIGFGTTFFLITFGQFIGPSIMGIIAGQFTLETAFYIAAAISGVSTMLGPTKDITSAAPENHTIGEFHNV